MNLNDPGNTPSSACCPGGNCRGIERRDFIKSLAVGAAAAALPVMAGPFEASANDALVPADKKLDPAWVQSLFARGTREVRRGKELEKIGMPIGGLCAGQLYLGGDGKLWHWDIFNQPMGTGDGNYAHPPTPSSPLEQGFALEITAGGKKEVRTLDQAGFSEITFCGEYPARQRRIPRSADPGRRLAGGLLALRAARYAGLQPARHGPALHGQEYGPGQGRRAAGRLAGECGLPVHGPGRCGPARRNRVERQAGLLLIHSDLAPPAADKTGRPDISFEDFQKETYEGWTVTGDAFGKGPILKSDIPAYQGDVGTAGPRVVNSHASAPGASIAEKDGRTGSLTSKEFTIERKFIAFAIGGGNNPGLTCVNLLVDGKVARTATGANANLMQQTFLDASELQGKTARLEIVDKATGAWGNIGVGPIVFTDRKPARTAEGHDVGTLAIALLDAADTDTGPRTLLRRPSAPASCRKPPSSRRPPTRPSSPPAAS